MEHVACRWGENGWFRIAKGVNNLGIESHCDFPVVKKGHAAHGQQQWPENSALARIVQASTAPTPL